MPNTIDPDAEEIAKLQITVEADIEEAQEALQEMERELQEYEKVSKESAEESNAAIDSNREAFLASAVAVGATLYAVMRTSSLAQMYLSEFGAILGFVADIIIMDLMPILDPLLDLLWQVAEWFADLPEPVRQVIGIIGLLGGAFLLLGPILGPIIGVFVGMAGAFSGLVGVIVANPIGLAIAGIVVAIMALKIAWDVNLGDIRGKWEWFTNVMGEAYDATIGPTFNNIIGGLSDVKDAFESFKNFLRDSSWTQAIRDWGQEIVDAMKPIASWLDTYVFNPVGLDTSMIGEPLADITGGGGGGGSSDDANYMVGPGGGTYKAPEKSAYSHLASQKTFQESKGAVININIEGDAYDGIESKIADAVYEALIAAGVTS